MLVISYASLIGLLRDRGALIMAFVLPALIFVIFAAVFSGTQGDGLEIEVVFADATQSEQGTAIGAALSSDVELRFAQGGAPANGMSRAAARDMVLSGQADAAIVVVGPVLVPRPREPGRAPVVVLADDAKPIAGALAAAAVQRALGEAVPGSVSPPVVDIEAAAEGERDPAVTYYAGAITIMFLFFAALQGAVGMIEDRASGIIDRLMLTRGGAGALVAGKYLFLTGQGAMQAIVVFAVAWLGYEVMVWDALGAFVVTTLLAATSAAGLAMAIVSVAATRAQALATGNALVLVMSAVGGSMVPRYMMPEWIQDLGAMTPTGWVIDAYQAVLFRDVAAADLERTWMLLAGFSVVALLFSWIATRWKERAA